MADKIIGILEQREGKLKRVSFEVLNAVAKLSSELGLEPEAIVIGNEIENLNQLSAYGVPGLTHFKNESLEFYSSSAYSKIIAEHAREQGAKYLVFANTSLGKDLAPLVSAKLDGGCLMDCVDLKTDNGEITATRPVYAGKALVEAKLNSEIKIITIRPNVFKPNSGGQPVELNISVKVVDSPNLKSRVVEFKKSEGKLDVAEADIIVSGGRGLKAPENFHLVEDLAEVLGAAVGASRAAVDAGWRPHREQVGQTGKTVTPSLYIACGISGAIQHLAGMSSSKYIVAINKDKDAPIFGVADYGIAGDVFEILPALTEEIKKYK